MKNNPIKAKINIIVDKQISEAILEELSFLGVKKVYLEAGRLSILQEREGLSSFFSKRKLNYTPAINIAFYLSKDSEQGIINHLITKFNFSSPGKGSIYSSDVFWLEAHPLCGENSLSESIISAHKPHMFSELKGICCIVPRGEGDRIAKICLEAGAGVPIITFGSGGGLRDKLGLLRITIPAEKELVNLVMSQYDVDSVMEIIIEQGKMDEPGRGFIYSYQVKRGVVDTKISRGKIGQVASIEKIVSAIDSIKGTMEWRKSRLESKKNKKRKYLQNLAELVLICDEGFSVPLMKAAMESGATGSTINKIYYQEKTEKEKEIPSARELCRIVTARDKIPSITAALKKAGAFEEKMHGLLYAVDAQKVFTYRP